MVQSQMFRIKFNSIKMSLEQHGNMSAMSAEDQANIEANKVTEEVS